MIVECKLFMRKYQKFMRLLRFREDGLGLFVYSWEGP